jgi:tetratricopeptide (TPR) repeat protein
MVRTGHIWLIALGVLGAGSAIADEGRPATVDTVFLGVREPNLEQTAPFLARELVRQAVLIAARDECGLATRDATLREQVPAPANPRVVPLEALCSLVKTTNGFRFAYSLKRLDGKTRESLWEWRTDVPAFEMIQTLAERAEKLSRGELKELLSHRGYQQAVRPSRSSGDCPHDAYDQLFEWNELTVLAGLRRIHAEIREQGESPELLGALAVGYANLCTLTEYHYSPAQKAFAARALLYSERLLRKTDGSAAAQWHRAYVRSAIGLYNLAAADVSAAKKRPKESAAAHALPFWTTVIERFCDANLPRMLADAKTPRERRLARYLNLDVMMWAYVNNITIKSARAVIEDSPDCLRAWDALCMTRQWEAMQSVTGSAFGMFSNCLRRRLPVVPGLPEGLRKRIEENKVPAEMEISQEIDFRRDLIADLKKTAESGQDRLEPSLAVVGQLIEEIQFKQLVRHLDFEQNIAGLRAAPTLEALRPLCEHHRYRGFLEGFSNKKNDHDAAAKMLREEIDSTELGYGPLSVVQWLANYERKPESEWLRLVDAHADPVFRDEMIGLRTGAVKSQAGRPFNLPYMRMMWMTSRKLPVSIAAQIDWNWKSMHAFDPNIEQEYGDDAVVISALARRYLKENQFDDAERCAKRKIAIAPDFAAYNALATIYEKKKDLVRWKETLEKSLSLGSLGLQEFRVRDRIAKYYMKHGRWKEAVVYADRAAESGAAWAMLTACRCHEMLEEFPEAESLMRSVSQSYPSRSMSWMVWCHRTGHGNVKAAEEFALHHWESLDSAASVRQLGQIGAYYLLKKEPEKALTVFSKSFEDARNNDYVGMHAAILADALGKAAERDANLAKIIELGKNKLPNTSLGAYAEIAGLMKKAVPPANAKEFDLKRVDGIFQELRKSNAQKIENTESNLQFFVAMYLRNRSDTEHSREYLIRCAASSPFGLHTYALACKLLREQKIPIPPPNILDTSEDETEP